MQFHDRTRAPNLARIRGWLTAAAAFGSTVVLLLDLSSIELLGLLLASLVVVAVEGGRNDIAQSI